MTALVLQADARCLPLADASVDLVVTSPPYFGLRSYTDGGEHYDGQIGSEATPAAYVEALLDCTREWMRVLKPSGSLWVNLGDKYSGAGRGNNDSDRLTNPPAMRAARLNGSNKRQHLGLDIAPAKSLMGLPWRYALGCIDQLGLILRAEVIWSKPNGLPESVTDRVRRSHEQLFHFTRMPRYYSAVDEIREAHALTTVSRAQPHRAPTAGIRDAYQNMPAQAVERDQMMNPLGKLPGSVWDIPSQPLTVPPSLGVDHFAAFPMELPRRIISGWSPPGICTRCGEGRRPAAIIERAPRPTSGPLRGGRNQTVRDGHPGVEQNFMRLTTITGYACACADAEAPPTRRAVVLDPFGGTGTTALIATTLGRTGISVDRSADYCRLAAWRTTDPGQRAQAMQVPKPPAQIDGQGQFDLAVPASP